MTGSFVASSTARVGVPDGLVDGNPLSGRQAAARYMDRAACASSSARAKAIVCAMSQPPSAQSVPDTRMLTGRSCRKAARTSSKTRAESASDFRGCRHTHRHVGSTAVRGIDGRSCVPVDLNVDADPGRPPGGGGERVAHHGQAVRGPVPPAGYRRPCADEGATVCQPPGWPGAICEPSSRWNPDRRLAPGVGELYRDRDVGMPPHALQRAGERGFGRIRPQAKIASGDLTLGKHGRFDNQQRRSRDSEIAKVDQVPVGGRPSSAEYWHIGAMTMRLRSSTLPTRNGERGG